ncbi:helix-turn-helix domain-containing protein [Candidatus Aerophobetes bacterium]|uniref:Helix-turn-helix domain-containing protein n=1 Tax=Aerophobetes bacterium TaxID=2030807 RepID=A0A523QIG6_UNCAE|nr:MAG: helix-turn-helix domain-containing protein [Candidatus Aerophobetes bacterium]
MLYFGEYLKELREKQRVSLRDVERRTGVSNAYLGQIEQAKRPPPHPNILKKLAPLYDVSVHELMAAAGYLDEVSSLKYKCLNPDCGEDFEARGAEPLRCPRCGTGYVLDWDTFEEVVLAEANWLIDPIGYMASHLEGHATVVRKLFPMLPFNAFRVIDMEAEKAKQRIKQSQKSKKERRQK